MKKIILSLLLSAVNFSSTSLFAMDAPEILAIRRHANQRAKPYLDTGRMYKHVPNMKDVFLIEGSEPVRFKPSVIVKQKEENNHMFTWITTDAGESVWWMIHDVRKELASNQEIIQPSKLPEGYYRNFVPHLESSKCILTLDEDMSKMKNVQFCIDPNSEGKLIEGKAPFFGHFIIKYTTKKFGELCIVGDMAK